MQADLETLLSTSVPACYLTRSLVNQYNNNKDIGISLGEGGGDIFTYAFRTLEDCKATF